MLQSKPLNDSEKAILFSVNNDNRISGLVISNSGVVTAEILNPELRPVTEGEELLQHPHRTISMDDKSYVRAEIAPVELVDYIKGNRDQCSSSMIEDLYHLVRIRDRIRYNKSQNIRPN